MDQEDGRLWFMDRSLRTLAGREETERLKENKGEGCQGERGLPLLVGESQEVISIRRKVRWKEHEKV